MKTKFTVFLVIMLALICSVTAFSQDRPDWSTNPSTRVEATGEYSELPPVKDQLTYQNPNKTSRTYHTSIGDIVVAPNIRPFPSTVTQSEVDIKTMGGNGSTMFASWNSWNQPSGPFYGTGFAFTNNEGISWTGNFNMFGGNNGDPGPWIWPAGSTWAGRLGISIIGSSQLAASYSTDNGVTWVGPTNMGGSGTDKNLSAVDMTVASPFFGRAYTVWTDFSGANVNRIVGAYSSNGGVSWTGYGPVSPVPPSGHHMQGCDVAVGPGGVVYCVWATCTTNGQNSTEDFLGFAKSIDGGVTWPVSNVNVVDINGIRSAALFNGIRSNGFPRIAVDRTNGNIYVVTCEKNIAPATDAADVCMCRSTDGGTTWTHTRVNQDTPGSGKLQYEAVVCVDAAGGVNVSYYDQRNTTSTTAEYWMSRSVNAGATWTDVAVSDHSFTPAPIPGLAGGYQGDYTGITASTSKVWPTWADNSSGIYQVWTSGISTGPPPAHDYAVGPFLGLPSQFLINQPYTIKTQVVNAGSSSETSVPIVFYIDGVNTNTQNRSLAAGQIDSVSNIWTTPGTAGTHVLKYICNLATDLNRANDTVQVTVNVLTAVPPPPANCLTGTYIPITGTPGPVGDDAGLVAPIGFNFRYRGITYTQAWICTNGFITLGTGGSTNFTNNLCTTTANELNTLCPFWDDLNTTVSGNIQYTTQGTTPNRIFIVQYTNVGYFSGSGNVTFQAKLYESQSCGGNNDKIEFIYGPAVPNGGATGSIGLNYSPGGAPNIVSATPGANCSSTTFSTSACNDAVPYNQVSGTVYQFVDCPVGIGHNGSVVPSVYSLAQNYPNPFNPTTTINFGIPKAGLVKLVVYDILGRVVSTLVNERKDAGMYNVAFDASNISSGVYFYKVEAGDFSSIKKMVLVK